LERLEILPCLCRPTADVHLLLGTPLTAVKSTIVLSADMSFSHEYQFIDGQDKNARKKTRAHVTREYYRERRWQQINAFKTGEEPGALHEPPKCPFVVSVTKLGPETNDPPDAKPRKGSHGSKTHSNRPSSSKQSSKYSQSTEDAKETTSHSSKYYQSTEDAKETTSQSLVKASPMTILGAGRVDPFQTFPIEATRDIHQLVDHCMCHQAVPFLVFAH
jgi:hypothetical protein